MKPGTAPTLSQHPLDESSKFQFYPKRVYRTEANLAVQEILDDLRRQFVEWRKTFAPDAKYVGNEKLHDPVFVDELYCRDLLRAIPEMVRRTRALAELALPKAAESEAIVYLRESASCFVFGLSQAAVALARAAVESRLRAACSNVLGERVVREAEFIVVINDLCRQANVLSPDARKLAHKVREAANKVLHDRPMGAAEALRVFEAARSVILGVGSR